MKKSFGNALEDNAHEINRKQDQAYSFSPCTVQFRILFLNEWEYLLYSWRKNHNNILIGKMEDLIRNTIFHSWPSCFLGFFWTGLFYADFIIPQ